MRSGLDQLPHGWVRILRHPSCIDSRMLPWTLTLLCALIAAKTLFGADASFASFGRSARERRDLRQVCQTLHEIEEMLETGFLPDENRWQELNTLPAPWGKLAFENTQLLRSQGGSVLPTLRRLRSFAQSHSASIQEAQSRASQALAQAWVCAAMVPFFGLALYFLLPGVSDHAMAWTLACLAAFGVSAQGGLWLSRMAERARWGGLSAHQTSWQLLGPCAVEKFLALLRCGTPADLSWAQCLERLAEDAPELARAWGHSIWSGSSKSLSGDLKKGSTPAAKSLMEAGSDLRKAIQVSLMEGRPCQERVETALASLRQELRSHVDRELTLLGTRALKPLFLCVAPSLFGLLFFAMFLGWQQAAGGWIG